MIVSTVERCLVAKIWHAFHALAKGREVTLDRSKSMVLTQSLVSALNLPQTVMQDFEERVAIDNVYDGVTFAEYQQIIRAHVLEKVKTEDQFDLSLLENDADSDDESDMGTKGERPRQDSRASVSSTGCSDGLAKSTEPWQVLDDLCWTLYSKQAISPNLCTQLPLESLQLLWQWYVLFSNTDDVGIVKCPVLMNSKELNFWLQFLFGDLLALDFHPVAFLQKVDLTFKEVLDAIFSVANDMKLSQTELVHAVKEFHDEVVCSLLRKGYLNKGRGGNKRQWKWRYSILTLNGLSCYSEKNMRRSQGYIPVSKMVTADPYRDKTSNMTYFQIETETALLVFKAEGLRSRNLWIRDIRFAIQSNRRQIDNVHFLKAEERKAERTEAEAIHRAEMEERQQLEQRNQELASTNEKLNDEVQTFRRKMQNIEDEKLETERERLLVVEVLEAKLHTVSESTKETMERLRREIEEKSRELDAVRQLVADKNDQLEKLGQTIKEKQKQICDYMVRNQELEKRLTESLENINQLENAKAAWSKTPKVASHRGLGAFPREAPNYK